MNKERDSPKEPQPVVVANPDPVLVTDVNNDPREVRIVEGPSETASIINAKTVAHKATTDARILEAAGQRETSNLWERTQQIIALAVVGASLTTAVFLIVFGAIHNADAEPVAFVFLASVANLVFGFYFGRTNHTRVGGIGGRQRRHAMSKHWRNR